MGKSWIWIDGTGAIYTYNSIHIYIHIYIYIYIYNHRYISTYTLGDDFCNGRSGFEGMMRQFVIGNCDFLMGRAQP